MKPGRIREMQLRGSQSAVVAGVDEVGRGALAGPVVAAAVILKEDSCPEGLDDSKKLTPEQRLELFHPILDSALAVAVYMVGPARIDSINILRASQEAMRRAVAALSPGPLIALVDGLPVPGFSCPHEALVKGDSLECCISAASIVAKVTRDRLMAAYAFHYPEYGFERNKGYGTPTHRHAIHCYGLSPLHRRSFCSSILQPGLFEALQ